MADETPKPANTDEPYTVEHSRDGSAVVRLKHPVKMGNESHSRAFIPALTGRHMRKAGWSLTEGATAGDLIAFAADVVEPLGIVDEMPAFLAREVANVVFVCLGKSQPSGDTTSSA
jgi:hypothetical protein